MVLQPIAPDRAQRIAAGLAGTHVLVVGDAMLDKFISGRVTRLSPEAPVPVVMFDHDSYRIGGAANVARCPVCLARALPSGNSSVSA